MQEFASLCASSSNPVLVTGHTGFKGTWLTLMLEEMGIPVVGLSLAPTESSLYTSCDRKGKIPEIFCDIESIDAVQNAFDTFSPQYVIHLAAQPLVLNSYQDPIRTFYTNVIGTANILEVATNTECVQSIAAITTDKVYKNTNESRRFIESDSLQGIDPYSASKVATESVINAWQNISDRRNHAKIISLRAGNVIGGGDLSDNRLIPDVIRNLYFEKELSIRSLDSTRPWQHVLDPLYGYLLAINQSQIDPTCPLSFNFGPAEDSLSVRDVLSIVNQLHPRMEFQVDPLDRSQPYEATKLDLDSSLAQEILNWSPKMSQKTAIETTLNWWMKHLDQNVGAEELCKNEIRRFLGNVDRSNFV
jgi:CDP-glucose 4,6-dehydratase